jgi:formate hydrogenlyase subunit 4
MGSSLALSLVTGVANVALVLLVSPLFEGVLRKVTAKVQSRQGPPLWQPYYDLLKLLGKEDIESGEVPGMQRAAAYISFAAILTVATLVPMGAPAPMRGAGDAVLLIYLLTLCGISTLLAGLAAGSTYSLLGMSREMMAMITLEPLLAVALVIGAVHTHSLRLETVLDGSAYASSAIPWAGAIIAGVLLLSLQANLGRVPFDMCEAETEIMEGPMVEYSGPKLALFKYVRMAKLVVYSALFVALFVPWGGHGLYPVNLLVLLAKILALVLLVTLVAATHARYRIDQAIRYYAGLFAAAMLALGLAVSGY